MQSLLSAHSDAKHGFMNCSPVEPVVIRRKHKHFFSDSASIPSNSQTLETKKRINKERRKHSPGCVRELKFLLASREILTMQFL